MNYRVGGCGIGNAGGPLLIQPGKPTPLLLQVNGLSQALAARETQLAEQSALLKKVRGLYLRLQCMPLQDCILLAPLCLCLW